MYIRNEGKWGEKWKKEQLINQETMLKRNTRSEEVEERERKRWEILDLWNRNKELVKGLLHLWLQTNYLSMSTMLSSSSLPTCSQIHLFQFAFYYTQNSSSIQRFPPNENSIFRQPGDAFWWSKLPGCHECKHSVPIIIGFEIVNINDKQIRQSTTVLAQGL